MAAGDLVVADCQVEIRGLLLGETTEYDLTRLPPGRGKTTKTGGDLSKIGDGETAAAIDFRQGRSLAFGFDAIPVAPNDLQDVLDDFDTAWADGGDVEIHWQEFGIHYMAVGRTRDWSIPDPTTQAYGWVGIAAEFYVPSGVVTVVP